MTTVARPILYRCPLTASAVQGTIEAEETPRPGTRHYKPVECDACGRLHLVNQATGRLLSEEADA